jgi:hypothetical protein
MNSEFRSSPVRVFLLKIWAPIVLLLSEVALLGTGTHDSLIFAIPTVGLAFLYFSAAQARPAENHLSLRYFYFQRWKEIPYEQVLSCKVSWLPGLGVLKLQRYVFPWGKIFFLLEGTKVELGWPGGQSAQTRAINDRREHGHSLTNVVQNGNHSRNINRDVAWCLASLMFAAALFLFINSQVPIPLSVDPETFPRLAFYSQIQEAILRWPWSLGLVIVLIGVIVWLKFDKKTVPLSLTLGALLGTLAAKFLS